VRLPAWVQFIFQADLTHSHLKSIILHDTFGLLGEIAEIFLFTPKPEGFIIFHDHLEIPNIKSMMSPQHHLILIKTPYYSSPPIREALAPDFTTRRKPLDTMVTLPGLGTEPYTATVVAIEQNHWSTEWVCVIRLENGATAFFFNRFERPIQVTIIEQGNSSFHLTVRNNL